MKVDTVTTSSKFAQKEYEVPTSVTVISRQEIHDRGFRNLTDLLATVRGFVVNNDRAYPFFGVRGILRPGDYNSRILLLMNGNRTNEGVFDSPNNWINIEEIERIEVIRGPGSSVYGTNAVLGIINIITGLDTRRGTVSGRAETHDGYRVYTDLQGTVGKARVGISASRYSSRGQRHIYFPEFDTPEENHGITSYNDGEVLNRFLAQVKGEEYLCFVSLTDRTKQIPTASYETIFGDNQAKSGDNYLLAGGSFSHTNNLLTYSSRASLLRYRIKATYPYLDDDQQRYLYTDSAENYRLNGDFRVDYREKDWLVSLGGEVLQDLRLGQKSYSRVGNNFSATASNSVHSVYFQGEIQALDKLRLVLGGRYDRYRSFGGTANPRLGIIVVPSESLILKANFGRAFRAPNAYEIDYTGIGVDKNKRSLQPEIARIVEGTIEYLYSKETRLTAAVSQTHMRDFVEQVELEEGVISFKNQGTLRGRSLELEGMTRFANNTLMRTNYTYADVRDGTLGSWSFNAPRHTFVLSTVVSFGRDLRLSTDLSAISRQRVILGEIPGYVRINPTLAYTLSAAGAELRLYVNDLLDRKPLLPAAQEHRQLGLPQLGRTVGIEFQYPFS